MAESNIRYDYMNAIKPVRSYEISIWTLQDRFLSVLKWANQDHKGLIQDPEMTLRDDGTEELSFTIPKYYYAGVDKIENPLWLHLEYLPIEANMHKLKVIFNKGTEDEEIFEFLVTSVAHDHTLDEVDLTIKAEGLAFHELGKIGYRVSFSADTYQKEIENYDDEKLVGLADAEDEPQQNILYWNDLIFKDSSGNWKGNWKYEVRMDWSAYSNVSEREINKVYEDEYTSSWHLENDELKPKQVEPAREKWRSVEISESNLYNITLTIAETFGVFCRYEYKHDENYLIIVLDDDGSPACTVVYYNNYYLDALGHIDITYPYSSSGITRTVDSSNVITKMYVQEVDEGDDKINIMDVEANKSREDYLLNFEYLHDILAITDEQYAAIPKYEADMYKKNMEMIEVQDYINAVKNLLIEVNASVTTLTNSVAEAKKLVDEAKALASGVTGGREFIPISTSLTVIEDSTGVMGLYVNTNRWPGLALDTILLFEDSDYTGKESLYSNPITLYVPIYDDDNLNIIRLANIVRTETSNHLIFIKAEYNPVLYYERLADKWGRRLIEDTAKLEEQQAEQKKLNSFLKGTDEDDYAVKITAIVADEDEQGNLIIPLLNKTYESCEVDKCRVLNEATAAKYLAGGRIGDPWLEYDKKHDVPNLEWRLETLLTKKAEIFNKFEKMMGPAMREGYWQPEEMHNYGDRYNDNFTLNILNGTNSNPKTAYLDVLWDCKKYYTDETPMLYEASIDKIKNPHLAIDLTSCLYDNVTRKKIVDNLEDLCFIYADPAVLMTIDELSLKEGNFPIDDSAIDIIQDMPKEMWDANLVNPDTQANGYIFLEPEHLNTNKSSLESNLRHYYLLADDCCNEILTQSWYTPIAVAPNKENSSDTHNVCLINFGNTKIVDENDNKAGSDNNAAIISEEGSAFIEKIYKKAEDTIKILKRVIELEKSSFVEGYNGRVETCTKRLTYITKIYNALGDEYLPTIKKAKSWIPNQIAALRKNLYRVYRMGAGCEIGWVKIEQPENDLKEKIVPALIVTGTSELPNATITYIMTGTYKGSNQLSVEDERYINKDVDFTGLAFDYHPLIGFYNVSVNTDGTEITNAREPLFTATWENGDPFFICGLRESVTASVVDDTGITRYPEWEEWHIKRIYPRLYFKTTKLKDYSSTLKIALNLTMLLNNKDYTIVPDDRSEDLEHSEAGYYLTLKPEPLLKAISFSSEDVNIPVELVYVLSNTDIAIYLDAIKVMKENSKPKVEYEVDLSILNPAFVHTAYRRLNQIVHINDNDLKLEDVAGYISSVTLKLDRFWEDSVEIKNYETKFEDLFSTIVAQSEAMKKSAGGIKSAILAFTSTGLLDGNILLDSLFNNEDINFQFNNGKLTIDNTNGIWGRSISKDGVEGVVAFRGGGIFTANKKDENDNWIWNTGIVPSGINASLITSGLLDTNRIKIYAGNEVRFLLNAQGLFAYKPFSIESELAASDAWKASSDKTNIPLNGVDSRLYVKYDSEGLFLIAKKGTWYRTGKINEVYENDSIRYAPEYQQTKLEEIKRVEISWDGLILRNWAGELVFYADPDTGNLTLKGQIEAKSGDIGGWQLTQYELSGNGIRLISGPTQEEARIELNPNFISSDTKTDPDGNSYFSYDVTASNDSKVTIESIIYLKNISLYEGTRAAGTAVYIEGMRDSSVTPLYTKDETTAAVTETYAALENNADETAAEGSVYDLNLNATGEVDPNSVETQIFIMLDAEKTIYALDTEGNNITYTNGDNIITADDEPEWYTKLKALYGENAKNYVAITKEAVLNTYTLANEITVSPRSSQDTTFRVKAKDGTVLIKQGKIGSFTIQNAEGTFETGHITNSRFDTNNTIEVNGQTITFGDLICNVQEDENGLKFIKVNGTPVPFNIAALAIYKKALADAAKIELTLSIDANGNAVATAKNGMVGVDSVTRTGTAPSDGGTHIVKAIATNSLMALERLVSFTGGELPSPSGGSSSNSGVCAQCLSSCFDRCMINCTNGCKDGCKETCTTYCGRNCWDACSYGCGTACIGQCSSGCRNGCKQSCTAVGGGGTGGCFVQGTMIQLSNGIEVPIEELTPGVEIVAYDTVKHKTVISTVESVQTFAHKSHIVDLIMQNGRILTLTKSHPVLTINGWKSLDLMETFREHLIRVTLLKPGDELLLADGTHTILTLIIDRTDLIDTTVYNIDVEPYDTYIAEGIIVHNAEFKEPIV